MMDWESWKEGLLYLLLFFTAIYAIDGFAKSLKEQIIEELKSERKDW